MSNNLLTIPDFIETARRQGAVFGTGDAKIHLAYLTKIGILPPAVKRKINSELVGCYPQQAIDILLKVGQMKSQGLTYSQIAKLLHTNIIKSSSVLPPSEQPEAHTTEPYNNLSFVSSPSFLYLIIGLLVGLLLATFNSQGLAQFQKQASLTFAQPPTLSDYERQSSQLMTNSASPKEQQPIYVIAVPKQNLDKLDKTNINYLINN